MSDNDITEGFSKLEIPRNGAAAVLRFLMFALSAIILYFCFPNSWSNWVVALSVGFISGALWAYSWFFKGIENRAIVWLFGGLGSVVFWFIYLGEMPSWPNLGCMYVGYEFSLLLFYPWLQKLKADSNK